MPISSITSVEREKIANNSQLLDEAAPFDRILTSTLRRSQETAREYGYCDYEIDPLLDELDFGPFEGKRKVDLQRTFGALWITNPLPFQLGETMIQFQARILEFLREYSGSGKLLVFGHGAWFRGMISMLSCGDIRQMNTFAIPHNVIIRSTRHLRGSLEKRF